MLTNSYYKNQIPTWYWCFISFNSEEIQKRKWFNFIKQTVETEYAFNKKETESNFNENGWTYGRFIK